MMRSKLFLALLILITSCLCLNTLGTLAFGANTADNVTVEIIALDPGSDTELALQDKLYIRLRYGSSQPVRFRVQALLNGELSAVGARTDLPPLHPPGSAEALVWLSFNNTTHIDTLRIVANDADWRPISSIDIPVNIRWNEFVPETNRQAADWVTSLTRKQKLQTEYVYDPQPIEKETIVDLIFLICLISVPLYLYVQVQMLRRYEGRWKELAAIPLVSLMPLILVSIAGIGMEFRLWLIFIFRGTPFALSYLVLLWLIKRIRSQPELNIKDTKRGQS